jgi:hypothetical protein
MAFEGLSRDLSSQKVLISLKKFLEPLGIAFEASFDRYISCLYVQKP